MIEIKINDDGSCQTHSIGSTQKILEGIRMLDVCRESILLDTKEKIFKELKDKFPLIPEKRQLELIDETIKGTLESITVLSEVNVND